jgi:DNA-binding IclR family transcriptional regulator
MANPTPSTGAAQAKSNCVDRTLRVLIALKGHTITGISNKELADGLGETPVNISRALAYLESRGLATKLDNGRWSHSVAMLQIATAYSSQMASLTDRISEMNRRVAVGAMG